MTCSLTAKGRQTQESSDEERPSETVLRSLILDSPMYPSELKIKLEDNEDSTDSSSSHLMSFHNYAKRRKSNNDEKNRNRYVKFNFGTLIN